MATVPNIGQGINPFDPDLEPAQSEAWYAAYGKQSRYNWQPKRRGKYVPRMATIDAETDPFSGPGHEIVPFSWGFYDGSIFKLFWGNDSTKELCAYIRSLDYPHILYAHNGGKFDFTFLLDIIEPEVFTIGTRIVKARVVSDHTGVTHELRDSFAIIPESLGDAAEKMEFDYELMKRGKREKNKALIVEYLKQDCVALYDTVEKFRGEFGDVLTMASASMKKLNLAMRGTKGKKGQPAGLAYERLTEAQDAELRPYYYGGHVECFKRGIFPDGPYKLVDINSSYANVMRNFLHPTSAGYRKGLKAITELTDFCLIDATSHGALPLRDHKTKELLFPRGRYLFQATGHEVRVALELGLLHIHKLHDAWEAYERTNFATFIDYYYKIRLEARAAGDKVFALFWKRVMNGAYGKFAQNPRKFQDTMIVRLDSPPPDEEEGWTLSERFDKMDIYTRQSDQTRAWRSFLNVGTGASITGAARAELLRGIHMAEDVLYCDTDSLICRQFHGLSSDTGLGQWKIETEAHTVAIGDKKIYAMWGDIETGPEGLDRMKKYGDASCVKLASKGVRATAADVLSFSRGQAVTFVPLAPTIRIDGSQIWTSRTLKRRDLPKSQWEGVQPLFSERSLPLVSTIEAGHTGADGQELSGPN